MLDKLENLSKNISDLIAIAEKSNQPKTTADLCVIKNILNKRIVKLRSGIKNA